MDLCPTCHRSITLTLTCCLSLTLTLVTFQDEEVLRAWLADLHFEEYFHLFVAAGYDMPTISRMTPEVCDTFSLVA